MKNPRGILSRSLRIAEDYGVRIGPGSWGVHRRSLGGVEYWTFVSNGSGSVCPLGALLLGNIPTSTKEKQVAKALHTSEPWVYGYVHGFDGHHSDNPDAEYHLGYRLGLRHRRQIDKMREGEDAAA